MLNFFTVRVLKHLLRLHILFYGFFGSQGFSVCTSLAVLELTP